MYKARPEHHMADWLSRQNYKNKDKEIPGMKLSINAIKICTDICMPTYEI